jgi:response regulator RpfG family c-di-GMP phosphodiesterase
MKLNQLCIMAVDDEEAITYHLQRNLQRHCKEFISFNDPQKAYEYLCINFEKIDILISDIRMPYLNGIELCKSAKLLKKNLITILLSASNDINYLMEAINEDIDKFIPKPYRIENLLDTLEHYAKNIINAQDAKKLKVNEELRQMQESIICMLGNVVENRSKETSLHVKRVALYSEVLGKKLNFDEYKLSMLKTSSVLHDLGKIAIDDQILNKPAKLSDEEFELIKTHTTRGYEILKNSQTELLKMAATIAYTHHENWDGSGYPCGLQKEQIPLEGRVVAICDVFDALTYNRCYKKAWSADEAANFIKEQKAKKFDPKLVDIFFESFDEIMTIFRNYSEN